MTTSKIAVSEGSGKNVSTYSITEDAVTKEIQRVVLSDSSGVERTAVTLKSQGYTARISVTRPANTTAYAANAVVGAAGTACITFANMGPGAGEIVITGASLERDVAALISGEANYILHLYNVTQPSAQADGAAFDIPSGDRAGYLGWINLGTPDDLGSTLYIATDGINKQITLASSSLFGVLVTVGAYTPASGTVHVVTLHSVSV